MPVWAATRRWDSKRAGLDEGGQGEEKKEALVREGRKREAMREVGNGDARNGLGEDARYLA